MNYERGTFDATIAAAAGEDSVLLAELRHAFRDSLERQLDLLKRARCDGNWTVAAQRLRSLAASFHASELADLASEAIDGAPGDPSVLRRIEQFRDHFVGA